MRKKLTAFIGLTLLIATSFAAKAQDYKPVKIGFGFGYAIPSDGGGGILAYLEPAYRVTDQIAVGLRIESAAMARAIGEEEGSISGNGSYSVNGIYYLSDNKFRPFVGAGVGIFTLASVTVGNNAAGLAAESKLGFYPRVGFDLGHFNMMIDYNIIGKSEVPNLAGGDPLDVKNGYIGVKLGFFILGGKN